VILLLAFVSVRIVVSLAESFASLAAALPSLLENPPSVLSDLQSWFDQNGIDVNVISTFESIVKGLLEGMTDLMVAVFGGVVGAVGTFVDAIIVVSLAVFMAIDRDKILRFGLDLVPPDRRPRALLFRSRVATAFVGFIRSQVILGALYGVWALLVSLIFGLPFAGATAFLAAVIMAIPIYGPYVSWLPPVLVALLVNPAIALPVAALMLVGWFIDENILAPLVRAGALELHPIVVTFAFLLGAQLAGAIGAIIAIPLAAVVQAFLMEYFDQYRMERGWPSGTDPAVTDPGVPVDAASVNPPAGG
jgi:predicted PurR-regulated permease PerM